MLNIAIICGGISQERGISLNSARSFLDHTSSLNVELTLLYVNPEGLYYKLCPGQLYSNTPSDFDFKLSREEKNLEEHSLLSLLKTMDIVFPLIHGSFGEDGTLQKLLETHSIPFVGSSSESCYRMFNKYRARQFLSKEGFKTLNALYIHPENSSVDSFWKKHNLKHAVIKPTESGSSIGVTYVDSIESANETICNLRIQGFHELLLEPYFEETEFTVCVLESHQNKPVALIPLEIDIGNKTGKLLDFRKKYLPTEDTRYYCPPRFPEEIVQVIRSQAEILFKKLDLRDFVRMDGWISKEGEIFFSDFNPISGMEQNSFLFQQAAKVDMTHADLIRYILNNALKRSLKYQTNNSSIYELIHKKEDTTPLYILLGGSTAERQVSLMSGTNVWLKLRQDPLYEATPFLLDKDNQVWQLPYAYTLHHTVEEVKEHCTLPKKPYYDSLKNTIRKELDLPPSFDSPSPVLLTFESFIEKAAQEKAFVFLALHGGIGEDGTLQKILETHKIPFNGSSSITSEICMDKRQTAMLIETLNDPMILSMPQLSFTLSSLREKEDMRALWKKASTIFGSEDLLIKPQSDGCSTGVLRLQSLEEFHNYIQCCHQKLKIFKHAHGSIEMSLSAECFLLEPFIHTDKISVSGSLLHHEHVSGWCEMTIGIFEKNTDYSAFPPSITVSEHNVLSLEEKFQGGTGINITPPPENILSKKALEQVKISAVSIAKALGIRHYARLDLFVQLSTGVVQLIEANTLPALTPSTVLFHQSLSLSPAIYPKKLLSLIIENASSYKENPLYCPRFQMNS